MIFCLLFLGLKNLCQLKWIILHALVMNFVFCIIFYIQEYSAIENYEVSNHKYERLPKNTEFNIENTIVPTANLKLNVFDKMLSEEMLSIKQHFHDRDSSHTPSVRISVQGVGATPTLEVKQKWPFENLFFKTFNADNRSEVLINDKIEQTTLNFTANGTLTYVNNDTCSKNECNSDIKDKVLELRSLPETRAIRICECMKTNLEPTCSHLCTGSDARKVTDVCKHTNEKVKHLCTRTASTISSFITYSIYPIYVTHPPYFWGISTYTKNPYYHPIPINEIKISKTKKRRKLKKPRPHVEESYQEVILEGNDKYDHSMENYINFIENYDEDLNNFSKHKSPSTVTRENEDDKFKEGLSKKLDYVNKDTFVSDVVEDLKEYYGDIVIKDCYCSLSSHNSILNVFLANVLANAYLLILLRFLI